MPRSLWNGTIAFGTVRVPVKLYSATESKAVRFHERHITDGAAIEHRRICVEEEVQVPYGELVKGFEVGRGAYVVLSKQELAAADGPAAHSIEIEHFVAREEIDPVYYERGYYLGPGKLGGESYRLLHAALKRSHRVGVGSFVFRGRARLIALRALADVIALHTMRFADEIIAPGELEVTAPRRKPGKLELDAARALVEQLGTSFQPHRYRDTYREAVLELIERKAGGEAIAPPKVKPEAETEDLLAALRGSLTGRGSRAPRRGGSRKPAAGGSRDKAVSRDEVGGRDKVGSRGEGGH